MTDASLADRELCPTCQGPMTSVFMIFELTQDHQILVPLMVVNLLAYAIATRFQPKPIYHALLEQDGIHLPGPASRFAAGTSRAGDIHEAGPILHFRRLFG